MRTITIYRRDLIFETVQHADDSRQYNTDIDSNIIDTCTIIGLCTQVGQSFVAGLSRSVPFVTLLPVRSVPARRGLATSDPCGQGLAMNAMKTSKNPRYN